MTEKKVKEKDYRKYRWFYTKSEKLVYGGKSADQNEEIVKELIDNNSKNKEKEKIVIMHTKIPGSPFAIINSPVKKVDESDLEETAVWTACFSRAWRSNLKKTPVDIFLSEQVFKEGKMKAGTFGVKGVIDRRVVDLMLVLIKQKGILRAVPERVLKENEKIFSRIIPGNIPKEKFAEIISERFNIKIEEVLNALPTGGFREVK